MLPFSLARSGSENIYKSIVVKNTLYPKHITYRMQLSAYRICELSILSIEIRLPSNLRPTTRECVHLLTRGHFRSRDKDDGHTVRSAVAEDPTLHANITAVCFITTGVIADRSFTLRE